MVSSSNRNTRRLRRGDKRALIKLKYDIEKLKDKLLSSSIKLEG